MKTLVDESKIEEFDAKKLFREVREKFDEYNINQLAMRDCAEEALVKDMKLHEECFTQINSDPTLKAAIKSEKIADKVFKFESDIKYVQTQFTDDESIIFNYSIIQRELDKVIMERMCKDSHRYYTIKRSCFLKIGLRLGLVEPKKVEITEVTQVG